jgi:hypothetical protein
VSTVSTPEQQRELALLASEGTCPRCGARRAADQEYCVECGLRLPPVTGRLAAFRRWWVRRFGWYPGDWAWLSLLTLAVAVAGAAVAIAITRERHTHHATTVLTPPITVLLHPTTAASPPVTTAPPATTTARTSTAPAHGSRIGAWPAGTSGWTIVLVSYPSANGRPSAQQTAGRALRARLPDVGILDSSDYASLQPGYLVVYTGVYRSQASAENAVTTAHAAGFTGAYVRQVAR